MMLTETRKSHLELRCLIPGDSLTEFDTFAKRFYRFIQPQKGAECVLTDELIANAWALLRVNRIQTLDSLPLDADLVKKYKSNKQRQYNSTWKDLVYIRDHKRSAAAPVIR